MKTLPIQNLYAMVINSTLFSDYIFSSDINRTPMVVMSRLTKFQLETKNFRKDPGNKTMLSLKLAWSFLVCVFILSIVA